jgi:hypothetical protein
MKTLVSAVAIIALTSAAVGPAFARYPTVSPESQGYSGKPSIVLAAITQVNGGGNTPGGNANGVPSKNPAGKEPPGHNKKTTGNPN